MMSGRRFALALGLLAAVASGCAGANDGASALPPAMGGSVGTGGLPGGGGASTGHGSGGTSGGCLTDLCVPPLTGPVAWAVEVDPLSSSVYAHTQIVSRDVVNNPFLVAETANPVSLTFNGIPNGAPLPSTANTVLTIAPLVPGRPDVVYQSTAVSTGSAASAMLLVPDDALGMAASLSLIPLPPADQQTPVYAFSATVSSNVAVTLPVGDVLTSGQLLDSLQNRPPATFVAKAFQNGLQVSNAPFTQVDGTFQLEIPAAAAANPLILELLPTSSDPWVTSAPLTITTGTKLGTITLPAYVKADTFSVAVTSSTAPIAPVSGVFVRAQSTLGATAGGSVVSGTAQYATSGTTDMSGNVTLPLLPGSTYAIAATPPPGSVYASQCVPMVKTVSGGTSNAGTPPNVKTIAAPLRPVLSGIIRTAGGVAVPNVSVSAIGTPDPSPPCAPPAAVTATTTTDGNGKYALPLDTGTYQVDYDPPAGSAAPRLTEWNVSVSGGAEVPHDVTLSPGALVVGSVSGAKGEALSSAVVRFFEVRCKGPSDCQGPNRVAPRLIGKALTDTQGRYRMVVPAQPAP